MSAIAALLASAACARLTQPFVPSYAAAENNNHVVTASALTPAIRQRNSGLSTVTYQTGGNTWGIAAGPDGGTWFTEPNAGVVGEITMTGVVTKYSVGSPREIVKGPDGAMWFTQYREVGRITPTGALTEYSVGNNSWGITVGADGNVWIASDYSVVRILPSKGTKTRFAMPAQCVFLTNGPDGNLWITTTSNEILVVSTSGAVVATYRDPFPKAGLGEIVTYNGRVYFGESSLYALGSFAPDGSYQHFVNTSLQALGANDGPYAVGLGPDNTLVYSTNDVKHIGTFSNGVFEPIKSQPAVDLTVGSDDNLWVAANASGVAAILSRVLKARPSSVSLTVGASTNLQISETNYAGSWTVTGCPSYVVSETFIARNTLQVSATGQGACAVIISDTYNNSIKVPVIVQ